MRPRADACRARDAVIANGLRVGHPGFQRLGDHRPTDVGAAADLAQAVAVAQRGGRRPATSIDAVAMRWLIELLGFPASFVGTFTSGGSTANLVGIGAARQHAGERLGLRPSLDGIGGLVEPRVYASTETHHVVGRALGVLGMGRRNLRSIAIDADGHDRPRRSCRRALDEDAAAGRTQVAIVGCAGDVNTGRRRPARRSSRGSLTSAASGSTSTARTAASGCWTRACATSTGTWRRTTRSPSIPTSGWRRRWARAP